MEYIQGAQLCAVAGVWWEWWSQNKGAKGVGLLLLEGARSIVCMGKFFSCSHCSSWNAGTAGCGGLSFPSFVLRSGHLTHAYKSCGCFVEYGKLGGWHLYFKMAFSADRTYRSPDPTLEEFLLLFRTRRAFCVLSWCRRCVSCSGGPQGALYKLQESWLWLLYTVHFVFLPRTDVEELKGLPPQATSQHPLHLSLCQGPAEETHCQCHPFFFLNAVCPSPPP